MLRLEKRRRGPDTGNTKKRPPGGAKRVRVKITWKTIAPLAIYIGKGDFWKFGLISFAGLPLIVLPWLQWV